LNELESFRVRDLEIIDTEVQSADQCTDGLPVGLLIEESDGCVRVKSALVAVQDAQGTIEPAKDLLGLGVLPGGGGRDM
jgi:hypothetical protein